MGGRLRPDKDDDENDEGNPRRPPGRRKERDWNDSACNLSEEGFIPRLYRLRESPSNRIAVGLS